MKKAAVFLVAAAAGYVVFLKVSELVQRQGTWHSVADPLEEQ
ncbi:MAG: DLW-39 family protein [Arcanobacterium sp.]|nr:DLW-39 family protein [Arcanobacterium sp.]MDY5588737.1 DLW-39 family protein [Arcanobacterium sp.]